VQPVDHNERRKTVRRKVFLGGKVVIGSSNPNPFSITPCLVKNITKDGARIQFPAGSNIPEKFSSEIPVKQCTMKARLIWLVGDYAGIRFDGFDQGTMESIPVEPKLINGQWDH
jgi:hypothetical protein